MFDWEKYSFTAQRKVRIEPATSGNLGSDALTGKVNDGSQNPKPIVAKGHGRCRHGKCVYGLCNSHDDNGRALLLKLVSEPIYASQTLHNVQFVCKYAQLNMCVLLLMECTGRGALSQFVALHDFC